MRHDTYHTISRKTIQQMQITCADRAIESAKRDIKQINQYGMMFLICMVAIVIQGVVIGTLLTRLHHLEKNFESWAFSQSSPTAQTVGRAAEPKAHPQCMSGISTIPTPTTPATTPNE